MLHIVSTLKMPDFVACLFHRLAGRRPWPVLAAALPPAVNQVRATPVVGPARCGLSFQLRRTCWAIGGGVLLLWPGAARRWAVGFALPVVPGYPECIQAGVWRP